MELSPRDDSNFRKQMTDKVRVFWNEKVRPLPSQAQEFAQESAQKLIEGVRQAPERVTEFAQNVAFEKKFEGTAAWDIAYEEAQAKLQWHGKEKDFARFRKAYERTWTAMAREGLKARWLGEAYPDKDPKSERHSREDMRKVRFTEIALRTLGDSYGLVGGEVDHGARLIEEEEIARKDVEGAREHISIIGGQLAEDRDLNRMSLPEVLVRFQDKLRELEDFHRVKQTEIDTKLAVNPEGSLKLELEQAKIDLDKKMTGLRETEKWLDARVQNGMISEFRGIEPAFQQRLELVQANKRNELLRIFEGTLDTLKQKHGTDDPKVLLYGMLPKIIESNKKYWRDKKGVRRLPSGAPARLEERMNSLVRETIAHWSAMDDIKAIPGQIHGVFGSWDAMMSIDWSDEEAKNSPLYQEMMQAVWSGAQSEIERAKLKEEAESGEKSAQATVAKAELDNAAAYKGKIEAQQTARSALKKRYGKWFPLFDPDLLAAKAFKTPGAAALESSEPSEASPLLTELHDKLRQEVARDSRVSFNVIPISRIGKHRVFIRLYPGKITGGREIKPASFDLEQKDIDLLVAENASKAREDGVKVLEQKVAEQFKLQLAGAGLAEAGAILSDEEIESRSKQLSENILEEITRLNRYGSHAEAAPEAKKEDFEKKDLETYFRGIANVYTNLIGFLKGVRIKRGGMIEVGVADLSKLVPREKLGALQKLIDRNTKEGSVEAARLKGHPGILDAKQIMGVLVVTFDSRRPLPEEFGKLESSDMAGVYRATRGMRVPIIGIDTNPTKYVGRGKVGLMNGTLQHELAHHAVSVTDYLITQDGLASAPRRGQVEALLGREDKNGSVLKAYAADKVTYKKLLGREFDDKTDPQRLYDNQGYLEEMAASLIGGKADSWLDFSNARLYSARNSERTGTSEELVGSLPADREAVVALITHFQSWRVLERTQLADWPAGFDLSKYQREGRRLWEKALGVIATARTVGQAEGLVRKLWETSEFETALESDAATLRAFQNKLRDFF